MADTNYENLTDAGLALAEMLADTGAGNINSSFSQEPAATPDASQAPAPVPQPTPQSQPTPVSVEPSVTRADMQAFRSGILDDMRSLLASQSPDVSEPDLTGDLQNNVNEYMTSDEFLDAYSEDPFDATQKVANNAIEKLLNTTLKPVVDRMAEEKAHAEAERIVSELLNTEGYEDMSDMADEISNYIVDNRLPIDNRDSYEKAYDRAKISHLTHALEERDLNRRTLDDFLADESALSTIMSNESIKNKIIEDYLNGLREGTGTPHMLSSGAHPATPPLDNSIKSWDDAGDALKNMFKKGI